MRNKKRIIVISALVLCLIGAGIVGGISLTSDSDAKETVTAKEETVTIVDKETGEKEVVEADSEEAKEAAKDPEMKVVANNTANNKVSKSENKSATKATTKSTKTTAKSESKNAKQLTYEANKKSSSSNSSSKNSSSKNSSSTNNSSSKNNSTTQATKPQHTHNWVAVTGTRQVPYQEQEAYEVQVCSVCGAEGVDGYHLKHHIIDEGYENAARFGRVKYRTVTKYKTETYTSGYKCSECGATK